VARRKEQPVKPSHPANYWTNDGPIGPGEHASLMFNGDGVAEAKGFMQVQTNMPNTSEGLEQVAVENLAAGLRQRGHKVAVLPRPGGDFPDAEMTVDGSSPIGIEVAEIVDGRHPKGAGYHSDHESLMDLIAEPVRKKIAKGYDRGGYGLLWLLLWETFPYALPPGNMDKAVVTARSPASPFDALWFCHITGDDVRCVQRWWPPDESRFML
jgi:hypothetical protein